MKTVHRLIMNYWKQHAEHVAEASCLHICPIKLVFYECSMMSLFKGGFVLRCFQHLSSEGVAARLTVSDSR